MKRYVSFVLGIVLMKLSPIIMLGKERCSLLLTLGWSESHVVCCLFDWRPSPDNGEMAMCRCYAVTLRYHHLTKSSSTTSSATSSALQSQGDPSLDSRDDTTSRHDGFMGQVCLLTPRRRPVSSFDQHYAEIFMELLVLKWKRLMGKRKRNY